MLHSQLYIRLLLGIHHSLVHFSSSIFVDKQNAVALSDKPWHCLVSYVDDLTGNRKLLIFYLLIIDLSHIRIIIMMRSYYSVQCVSDSVKALVKEYCWF